MDANIKNLRDALENLARFEEADLRQLEHLANRAIDEDIYGGGILLAIVGAIREGKKALASPPRNCDRFATEEDANAAFDKMCDLRGDGLRSCIGCKYNGGERGGLPSISRCRVAWLFDTATPEGDGNGSK